MGTHDGSGTLPGWSCRAEQRLAEGHRALDAMASPVGARAGLRPIRRTGRWSGVALGSRSCGDFLARGEQQRDIIAFRKLGAGPLRYAIRYGVGFPRHTRGATGASVVTA